MKPITAPPSGVAPAAAFEAAARPSTATGRDRAPLAEKYEHGPIASRMLVGKERDSMVARLVLAALCGYKHVFSPLFAGSCRFTPSCADYMAEAVRTHGAAKGVWLGLKRLARCHPFGPWGMDPVPAANSRERGSGRPVPVPLASRKVQ